jgi:hypothetical protein
LFQSERKEEFRRVLGKSSSIHTHLLSTTSTATTTDEQDSNSFSPTIVVVQQEPIIPPSNPSLLHQTQAPTTGTASVMNFTNCTVTFGGGAVYNSRTSSLPG